MPTFICQWINSFLTDRQQLVRLWKYTSSTRTISTGAPQGCVLSPLLFYLYTNYCTSKDPSVELLKFADDTTLNGFIQDGDESAYRQEDKELAVWCSLNNVFIHHSWLVEWTSHPYPECWVPEHFQATPENSSLPSSLDICFLFFIKKNEEFFLSFFSFLNLSLSSYFLLWTMPEMLYDKHFLWLFASL